MLFLVYVFMTTVYCGFISICWAHIFLDIIVQSKSDTILYCLDHCPQITYPGNLIWLKPQKLMPWILMKPQQWLLLPVVAGGYTNTCNVTSIIQEYTEQRQHFQGIYIILFKKIIYNIHHSRSTRSKHKNVLKYPGLSGNKVTIYCLSFKTFTQYFISDFNYRYTTTSIFVNIKVEK